MHFMFFYTTYRLAIFSLQNEAEATKIALEKEKSKAKLTLDQSLKDMRQQLTKEWSERLKYVFI